ncbi:acyl carrier protein [Streptomyces sp. ISL-98]|uniref:acyl carrier protein n=1 Tax=Streptomyces sp. ISL-98 TaxID=2819192 RepID=UPI001BE6708A|nr:acyl carrier protein [Streptomyces sp. ISL-98]MBT2505640.1 acyl carrier protein [Streptomyces sp. ISL-98]
MNDLEDFIALVRDELGVPVAVEDAGRALHDLPGWDSLHLLRLVTVLEARTGRSINVIDLLEAPSLEFIYGLAATG